MTSDHWPVEISVNIPIATCDKKNCEPAGNKRLLWKEAGGEVLAKYQTSLERELNMIEVPYEAAVCELL